MALESLEQRQARAQADAAHDARNREALQQEKATLDRLHANSTRAAQQEKALGGPVSNKALKGPAQNKAGAVNATDSAIELAEAEGIDLSSVQGSGADGRITKADVQAAIGE